LGTGILNNVTDGGEGHSNPSKATREKMAFAKRNESIETKEKRSIAAKNRIRHSMTDDTKLKIAESKKGNKHSAATKEKMSMAKIGRKMKGLQKEKISATLLGVSKPQVTCPHCSKTGGVGAMGKWHFNNCKTKPEIQN
jgi:hypothetical protein